MSRKLVHLLRALINANMALVDNVGSLEDVTEIERMIDREMGKEGDDPLPATVKPADQAAAEIPKLSEPFYPNSLIMCPDCGGPRFHVTQGRTLKCANRSSEGCGWREP
jgi:hypothetical protein